MSKIILKKNGTDYLFGLIPLHYPADRVYLDGDTTKTVQDKVARKADLTNLDLTGTTNTTGSTIATGTYFYLNGVLVRAKTAIASGATFTLNTNYEVATVGDAINEVKHRLMKTEVKSFVFDGNGVSYINEKYIDVIPQGDYIIARLSANYMRAYALPNATLAQNVTISTICTYIS